MCTHVSERRARWSCSTGAGHWIQDKCFHSDKTCVWFWFHPDMWHCMWTSYSNCSKWQLQEEEGDIDINSKYNRLLQQLYTVEWASYAAWKFYRIAKNFSKFEKRTCIVQTMFAVRCSVTHVVGTAVCYSLWTQHYVQHSCHHSHISSIFVAFHHRS